jgi:hypothetical protein
MRIPKTKTETVNIDTKINSYDIEVESTYIVDTNACADIDGNRSRTETHLDDFQIHSVINTEKDLDIIDRIPTVTMNKLYDLVYKELTF